MATVFSGGTYVNTTFTGTARSDIQKNIAAQLVVAGWTNLSGATGTGTGPGNVGAVTITIASPGVVTFNSHGFLGGERIILQTTGALPTGLSVNTVYFVKFVGVNTFNLSLTLGGANINTSGSQSGTHTLNTESFLLQSATQSNVTNAINVRLKDNRGNCIQTSIENTAGTVVGSNGTSSGGSIVPGAGKVYQFLATKYRWECFTIGASASREFVMVGMMNIPSNIVGTTDHGYLLSNAASDTDVVIRPTIQTTIGTGNQTYQFIWNTNLLDATNTGGNGVPQLVLPNSSASRGLRWSNDALNGADVLVSSGLTSQTDEGKIKGLFYDMVFIGGAFAANVTDTFNGHNWYNISNNLSTGGIWVATS